MDKKGYPGKGSKKPSSGSNSSGRQHGESSSRCNDKIRKENGLNNMMQLEEKGPELLLEQVLGNPPTP
ncbi:LOW QUALITY PROTEIN: hypothetical protein MKX08_002367 [Trichoderma sp. CBMAI-0020]|nr:LOW QUALITY PROTEIN: hypothetical protein MKX08_002367 [Trichoderma sp. CBMAI-0020]